MDTVALGSSGRRTTRLGFGSSSILGALNRRQSLALLESAFDAGIRHFDTAPMYGFGEAEGCVGEFLQRHRGVVTITTKFGIAPAPQGLLSRTARTLARPVLQNLPGLKRRVQTRRAPGSQPSPQAPKAAEANPIFTAENARRTLENSLAQLRTERIDVWLLHDVKALDLADAAKSEPLLRFMEDAVRKGTVGLFGVGTDRSEIPGLLGEYAPFCPVAQYGWSVFDPPVEQSDVFRIHHRALRHYLESLSKLLREDSARRHRWSEAVGQDLGEPGMLARLMVRAAYSLNPDSVLLFSSKSPAHIRENVANTQDESLDQSARRLYTLLQGERSTLGDLS